MTEILIDIMTVFLALAYTEALKRVVIRDQRGNMKKFIGVWLSVILVICFAMVLIIHFTDIKLGLICKFHSILFKL